MRRQKPMTFDELLKDLQGENKVEEDPNHISLTDLFHDQFMRKHTRSGSFAEFMEKGNFQASNYEDIDNLHDELLDRHVARETDFENWQSMLSAAKEAAERGKNL